MKTIVAGRGHDVSFTVEVSRIISSPQQVQRPSVPRFQHDGDPRGATEKQGQREPFVVRDADPIWACCPANISIVAAPSARGRVTCLRRGTATAEKIASEK